MTESKFPSIQTDTESPSFKALRAPRAFEEIAAQIRNELAEGRLTVGSRLPPERALAAQFGVSRNTLREAIRSLEHAGLIRLQKGATGGAFINLASGNTISNSLLDMFHMGAIKPEQLTEARIWTESIIVRQACAHATPSDIEELKMNIQAAEAANKEGDFARRAEIHLDFHRILARIAGNPIMMIMMNGLLDVLKQFVTTIGFYENKFVIPSRRRFMKHMENGDADAAVAEMENSLKRLQRGYLSKIEGQPIHKAHAK
jgi:GntR family transcriptional repressor for pyruvate dehydrogenase complex